MTEDLKKKTITNGIGWVLYGDDGREVSTSGEGEVPTIETTDEETELCGRIADRVLSDLAELERREGLTPGPTSREILERQAGRERELDEADPLAVPGQVGP